MTGCIFDIMKYSVHDGPGIRTTVFLKGCPLNCWWCHNPEGQALKPEIMLWPNRCIGCGECQKACQFQAMAHPENCTQCGKCAEVCPAEARVLVGRTMSIEETLHEIEKDMVFYRQSGGGVTFSGGEPLMQPDFLEAMLKVCRQREIHTALETTGYARPETLLRLSSLVDLFLYDLKLMDDAAHRKYTGVSNRMIIENLKMLAENQARIIARVPIIPGINDDQKNINDIGELLTSLKLNEVHLLPYHRAGTDKYRRLNRTYLLPDLKEPTAAYMAVLANQLQKFGLTTKIGG